MTHVPRHSRSKAVIPLLIAALGAALGAAGVLLLQPFGGASPAPASSLTGRPVAKALNAQAIYDRLEPSIVDVTSTLRYDDETASGTGFIVDGRAGLILTNNHVIRDATSVSATLTSTGKSYPARIVGVDVAADIAVLQIPRATGLTAVPLGDSAAMALGTPVLAIGNQAGQGGAPTIAPGIINDLNRTIQANDGASGFTETLHGMLQTSAKIEPGDSGGPLADAAGAVVGVDTAAGAGNAAAGYAIPINGAMTVARLIAAGRAAPGIILGVSGFLGVVVPSSKNSNPLLQARAQHGPAPRGGSAPDCVGAQEGAGVPSAVAPARSGALVDGVLCGTGAAAAGIRAGDVITSAAGHRVVSPDGLTAIVSACRPGKAVLVTWVSAAGVSRTSMILLQVAPAVLTEHTWAERSYSGSLAYSALAGSFNQVWPRRERHSNPERAFSSRTGWQRLLDGAGKRRGAGRAKIRRTLFHGEGEIDARQRQRQRAARRLAATGVRQPVDARVRCRRGLGRR